MPRTPNETSIKVHRHVNSRIGPVIRASKMIARHQIMPHSITQMLRTGSRHGPRNATAMTRRAKASQSELYGMKGVTLAGHGQAYVLITGS